MTDPTENDKLPYSCDLVMKGGITSGVVYPTAIVDLARDHRLHNIGGASAGAIAAVVTAAAEYGRQTDGGGFAGLAEIPTELATVDPRTRRTLLQRLFVPQPETKEFFDLFLDQKAMKGSGAIARVRRFWPSLMKHSKALPEPASAKLVSFGLPAGAVAWAVVTPSPGTIGFAVLALVGGGATYVGSRTVSGLRRMINAVQKEVAGNMHGMVNGSSVDGQIGLTEWMHEQIERLAGPIRADGETHPVTYGDLHSQQIGLVTLTTNLSQASSENFPFDDETWAFCPRDLDRLLPPDVTAHLRQKGEAATAESTQRAELEAKGLLKLPPADQLPIVLGARVSLSFPLLISAVPLWRLVPVRTDGSWSVEYQQVWLSDGGICSNMPVHLFDSPLPRRPTYGISLSSGAEDGNPGAAGPDAGMTYAHRNVWRPISAGSGGGAPIGEITNTMGLLSEVFNTMQNWSDNSMTRALGVRDRICTIRLGPGEGGMHLDMSDETILGLAPRGRAAGENLAWMVRGDAPDHAEPPKPKNVDEAQAQWTRHRWTRLRSTALGLGRYIDNVAEAWKDRDPVPQDGPHANSTGYPSLAAMARSTAYLPYQSTWTDKAGADLNAAVEQITSVDFGDANTKSPPPYRRLTLSPRTESPE